MLQSKDLRDKKSSRLKGRKRLILLLIGARLKTNDQILLFVSTDYGKVALRSNKVGVAQRARRRGKCRSPKKNVSFLAIMESERAAQRGSHHPTPLGRFSSRVK